MLSVFDGPSYVFLSFFCYISRAHVTGCLCLTGHRMSFFHFSVILVELMLLVELSVFDGPSYVFLSFFCYISRVHVTCCLCLTDHRMSFFHFSVILVKLMLLVVCV